MSSFKVETTGYPHMLLFGLDQPSSFWQKALDDPSFGKFSNWKHPSIKTFGFDYQKMYDQAIPTNNGDIDGSFEASEDHFDIASLSLLRHEASLLGGSSQLQWVFHRVRSGGLFAVELTAHQAKHFSSYLSKRLDKYSLVREGTGSSETFVIFGSKKKFDAKGSAKKERATARAVEGLPCLHNNFAKVWKNLDEETKINLKNTAPHPEIYPCFAPESFVVSGHADRQSMPRKWRGFALREEFIKNANFKHPADLTEDSSSDDGFGRPPMSPSVLSVTKYLASGRFADKSTCPETGMVFYARGYLKKKIFRDKVFEDGVEVSVKTEMNQTEGWTLVLERGTQNTYREGQFYYASFA